MEGDLKMRTVDRHYIIIDGGRLREVYKYRDKRHYIPKDVKDDSQDKIMPYLYTLLIIGLLVLAGMHIIDIYFDKYRSDMDETALDDQSAQSCNSCLDLMVDQSLVLLSDQYSENISGIENEVNIITSHQASRFSENILDEDPTEITEDSSLEYVSSSDADVTIDELEFIYRVVEAEVTGTSYRYGGQYVNGDEMLLAKLRVAQVFLNRVKDSSRFPHITTLYEAVSEENASSTVASGRYLQVEVTDLTRQAVEMAMDPNQEDLTDGALFFLAGGATENKYGEYLFTDAVGHSFFK